jgi:hypothetical protein
LNLSNVYIFEGSAYVYRYVDNIADFLIKLHPENQTEYVDAEFGKVVTAYENGIAVGAPGENNGEESYAGTSLSFLAFIKLY